MSNKPVQFKSKRRKKDPRPVEVDDEQFLFAAKMGTVALEHLADDNEIAGLFGLFRSMIVDADGVPSESDYRRFVALDLEFDELKRFFGEVAGMYGLAEGESSASSTSSADDGANSSPTSNGSTPETSTPVLTS